MIAGLSPAPSGVDRAGLPFGAAATPAGDSGAEVAVPFGDVFVALMGAGTITAAGALSPTERTGRGAAQAVETAANSAEPADDETQAIAAISSALVAFLAPGALASAVARDGKSAGGETVGDDGQDRGAQGAPANGLAAGGPTGGAAVAPMDTATIDRLFEDQMATVPAGHAPVPTAPAESLARSLTVREQAGRVERAPGREAPAASALPATAPLADMTSAAPAAETAALPRADAHVDASGSASPAASTAPPAASTAPPASTHARGRIDAPDGVSMRSERAATDTWTPLAHTAATAGDTGANTNTNAGTNADQQPPGDRGASQRRPTVDAAPGIARQPVPGGIPQGLDPAVESTRPSPRPQDFRMAIDAASAAAAEHTGAPGAHTADRLPLAAGERPTSPPASVLPWPTAATLLIEIEHPLPAQSESAPRGRALDEVLPTQIVQSLRMQWAAGGSEAKVQLRPEYLGELTVSIKVEQGAVVTTLHAESADVRRWIEANTATLRDGLAEHGLRLERVIVREPGDTAEPDAHQRRDAQRPPQRRAAPDQRRRRRGESAPTFDLES